MPASKLLSMREAVARFVPDGSSICLNAAIEALIPFAAGHELIRQHRDTHARGDRHRPRM